MSSLRLLLDTQAALWWWRDLDRLGPGARAAIEDGEDILVSSISAYEIALKWRLGKLPMIDDPLVNFPILMAQNDFQTLAMTESHALRAGLLPVQHRDPFDRIIAAQALEERLTVVTCDPQIAAFGCKVLW